MPRRKKVATFRREIIPDPVYGSEMVQRLINVVMWRGKKTIARKIVYDAMQQLENKAKGDKAKAVEMFNAALEQLMPVVEVRPRRVGGSVYQIPREVGSDRRRSLAMRWLISAAAARSDSTMGLRLGYELLEALEGRGAAIKKKADVHKMAEANRAFSHYAW